MKPDLKPTPVSRIRQLEEAAGRLVARRRAEPVTLDDLAAEAGMPIETAREVVPDGETLIRNVADAALARLNDSIVRRMAQLGDAGPRAQIRALGMGYLEWALSNPTHLLLVSDRDLTAMYATPMLQRQEDAIGDMLQRMLARARADGDLSANVDCAALMIGCRAFVYGLARMSVDGNIARWVPAMEIADAADPLAQCEAMLDAFLNVIFQPEPVAPPVPP